MLNGEGPTLRIGKREDVGVGDWRGRRRTESEFTADTNRPITGIASEKQTHGLQFQPVFRKTGDIQVNCKNGTGQRFLFELSLTHPDPRTCNE